MKMLIVRSYGSVMNVKSYNTQEIGLAKAFRSRGIETDIVFYAGDQETRVQEWPADNGGVIKIFWLTGKQFMKHGYMPEVFMLADQYDFLWLDEFDQYQSSKLARMYPKKTFIYHGPYPQSYSWMRKVRDTICNNIFFDASIAEKVRVFTKSNLAQTHLEKMGFKNVRTIGVGLDTERFVQSKAIDLNEFGINDSDIVLSYIGTIDERRNVLFALNVLSTIVRKRNNVKLLLVGKENDRYWRRCVSYIEKKGLRNNVVHIKKLDQDMLPSVYIRSTAFLFPTLYDIFGMVLLEAMYFGTPVVSSVNGGSTTLIKSGENGYICDFDVEQWASALEKILLSNSLQEKIGDNARKTIRNRFTWGKIADNAIQYMKEMM